MSRLGLGLGLVGLGLGLGLGLVRVRTTNETSNLTKIPKSKSSIEENLNVYKRLVSKRGVGRSNTFTPCQVFTPH